LEDRLDRDARGRRRGVLAGVLRRLRPAAGAGRIDRPADDHDAAPPLPGVAARLRMNPQVHLPRRPDPLAGGDPPDRARRLAGTRVWVCGASSGIGAALVRELAARGCRVAASARRADRLDELAGSARGDVVPLTVDVTDRAAMMAAEADIRGRFGAIDLAVL